VPLPSWLEPVEHDPAYAWAITAWDRAAAVPNSWFDAGKADRVVALWPTVFRLTDLRFAGVPFRLLKWQEIIVRLLVGWKVPAEVVDPATGRADHCLGSTVPHAAAVDPAQERQERISRRPGAAVWALEGNGRRPGYTCSPATRCRPSCRSSA
jgi:hypothetical protein